MYCKKCDSGQIEETTMWQVTGQVDGQRNSTVVATCKGCGNKWAVEK